MNNFISRLFGKIVTIEFPECFQSGLNRAFISLMKIDLSEFEAASAYPSIQKLFTRELKQKRAFSKQKTDVIAPTDSKVVQYGDIEDCRIMQVKGLYYDLSSFLTSKASEKRREKLKNGKFINFYLSLQDYHRFHSPVDLRIDRIIHVPGQLFPVKKSYMHKKKNLFVENERVILEGKMLDGKCCYFVAIGALNVGKIKIHKEPKVQTNLPQKTGIHVYDYPSPLNIPKGADLGVFEMGSSVVCLFEKDSIVFAKDIEVGAHIKYGDTFGKILVPQKQHV